MLDVFFERVSELNVLTVHNDGNFLVCHQLAGRAHMQNRHWRFLVRLYKEGSTAAKLGKRCCCRQQREEA